MAIKPSATGDAPAPRRRKPVATPAGEVAAPAATEGSVPAGIQRTGGGITRVAERPGRAPTPTPQRDLTASVDDWAHTDVDEAAAKSLEEAKLREADRAANIYWPRHFYLNENAPKNQADIIILDAKPGPRMYTHMMRGARDDFPKPEPCPREWEICPICPPNGEHHSVFTMVLSIINMAGYTKKTGQVVGATKEVLLVRTDQHLFFDQLYKEHGSLRGIQLLMKREGRYSPQIGVPTFVGHHTDEEIEAWLKKENLWGEVLKEGTGEVLFPEGSLAQQFDYNKFVKKPSAADLLARFGGQAPMGSDTANQRGGGGGQFGGGRYAPRAVPGGAQNTNFGGFGGGVAGAELDDTVPFATCDMDAEPSMKHITKHRW